WEILRKEGSTVWAEVSISFILDAEGHLAGVVGSLRDVSQRKKAEEALRDSEERLRQVFEAVADGIAVTDLQGSITQANQTLAKIHGFATKDDIIGKNISDLLDPQGRDKAMRRIQYVLDVPGGRGFATTEYTLKRADGSRFCGEVTGGLLRDARGNPVGFVTSTRDTTERKSAEEKTRQLARFPGENPNPVLRIARDGTILYANEASLPLLTLWGSRAGQPLPDHWHKVVADVVDSGRQSSTDVQCQDRVFSLTFTPIERTGYVNLYGLDITKHKQAEEALSASEAKHRILFETMMQGIVYQDADGVITSANPAAEGILGLTLDEMQGRTSIHPRWKAIHEDGSHFRGETHPSMVALTTGEEAKNVVMGVFNPKDETHHWISIDAVPQFRPGESRPYQVYTCFTDITERKRAEDALRDSEAKYAILMEQARDGVLLIQDGIVVFANRAMMDIGGYTLGEVINMPFLDKVAPESRRLIAQRYEARLAGKEAPSLYEAKLLAKDGRLIDAEISAHAFGYQGRMADLAIVRDVTQRKLAEKALAESEERFHRAFESANSGMYLVDLDGHVIQVNNKMSEILGYSMEQMEDMTVNDFTHAEDRDITPEFIRVALAGEVRSAVFEKRFCHRDGHVVLGRVSSALVRDARGNPLYFISHVQDITAHRQAEEALR
ncbi:MAG: PAS domain S-box protein, partial [Chloroflexi bacterium]|nr:PAS domain S-box protein [Chloroflexota bacterium]